MANRSTDLRVNMTAQDRATEAVNKLAKRLEQVDGETAEVILDGEISKAERKLRSLTKQLGTVTDENFEATVDLRDEATERLELLRKELDKLGADQVDIDVDGSKLDTAKTKAQEYAEALTKTADEIGDELSKTIIAADKLGNALGPELRAKVSEETLMGLVSDARKAGLEFDDLEANVDQVAASLKRMDDINVSLGGVSGGFDKVRGSINSADQSRSVFANAMGNMAGEVAPAFGPINMAIGQFVEYASEGNINLKQMAKLAGPIAAVGGAIYLLQSHLKNVAETKAFEKERVLAFIETMADATTTAQELREVLASDDDPNSLMVRVNGETKDVEDQVRSTIGTFGDFKNIVEGGEQALSAWASQQLAAGAAAGMTEEQLKAYAQALADATEGNIYGQAAIEANNLGYLDQLYAAAAAGQAIRQKGEADREAGRDAEFYGTALDGATEATDRNTAASDTNRQLAEQRVAVLDREKEAELAKTAAILAGTTSMFSYESAQIALAESNANLEQSTAETNAAIADGTLKGAEAEAAQRDLRQEQISAAEQALRTAEAFANQSGAQAGTELHARYMRNELIRMRDQYPGLRGEIDAYIGRLNQLDGRVVTTYQNTVRRTIDGGYDFGVGQNAYATGGTVQPTSPNQRRRRVKVGENGAEYVDLPVGSEVTPSSRTRAEEERQAEPQTVVVNQTTVNNSISLPPSVDIGMIDRELRRYRRDQGIE